MSSVSPSDGGYNYYAQPLNDLESEMKDETRRTRDRYDARADELEKHYRKAAARNEEQTQDTIDRYRRDSAEEAARSRDYAKSEVDRARAQTYDKYGRAQSDIAFAQKRADEAIRQSQEQLAHDKRKLQTYLERTQENQNSAILSREMQDADNQRMSHERETADLRRQMGRLIDAEKTYMKERGQGTVDARRDVEEEARTREHVLRNQYEAEIGALKRKSEVSERDHQLRTDETQRQHDLAEAHLVHRLTQENQDELHMLQRNDQHAIEAERSLGRRQNQLSNAAMERLAADLGRRHSEALRSQAQTYGDTLQRQRDDSDLKLAQLQDQLRKQMSSSDTTYVSPAAEAALERTFTDKYEKVHQAEVASDKANTDSIQHNYARRVTDTVEAARDRIAQTEARDRAEEHLQQEVFINHVDDVERNRDEMLKSKDEESLRHDTALNRDFSISLEKQRREYESLLGQTKLEANEKVASLRQQSEFDSKMAQRKFTAQMNALSKSYRRQLEDQKNRSDDTIADLKEQLATRTREAERRTQKLLDEQSKGYEQRIAQMEYTSQERERTISENYQDQIEKLKRSNALLNQRQSEKS